MNTTKNTRSAAAAAILLGSVLVLTPFTAHASQTGTATTMMPTGPDIALSATDNLRQLMEADRAQEVSPITADKTLRQLIEEDRAPEVVPSSAEKTLRQLMEEDRAPEAAIPLLPPTEVPSTADKTLRQLMEEDRG
jgi:hypothetical protein